MGGKTGQEGQFGSGSTYDPATGGMTGPQNNFGGQNMAGNSQFGMQQGQNNGYRPEYGGQQPQQNQAWNSQRQNRMNGGRRREPNRFNGRMNGGRQDETYDPTGLYGDGKYNPYDGYSMDSYQGIDGGTIRPQPTNISGPALTEPAPASMESIGPNNTGATIASDDPRFGTTGPLLGDVADVSNPTREEMLGTAYDGSAEIVAGAPGSPEYSDIYQAPVREQPVAGAPGSPEYSDVYQPTPIAPTQEQLLGTGGWKPPTGDDRYDTISTDLLGDAGYGDGSQGAYWAANGGLPPTQYTPAGGDNYAYDPMYYDRDETERLRNLQMQLSGGQSTSPYSSALRGQ